MNRFDLTKRVLAQLKNDEAVVGGIGFSNFDLWAAGRRPQNYHMLGSMGLAVPIALGVAIAQPDRHVLALEGDGSILMQLGVLGTIASRAQRNLTVIVWDNGAYQITGGQPATTASTVDLVEVARASGIRQSHWAKDEVSFETLVRKATSGGGPTFIAAKVDDKPAVTTTHRDPVYLREVFMRGIGTRQDPATLPLK
jgi:thiamine pyrophosphate-dependent acetolactate synthase large subunit-like protein